jgi:hypothetical protein
MSTFYEDGSAKGQHRQCIKQPASSHVLSNHWTLAQVKLPGGHRPLGAANRHDGSLFKRGGDFFLHLLPVSATASPGDEWYSLPSRYISGDSMSSLLYIWPLYIRGAEPATSGATGVKIWHPPGTGWEKGDSCSTWKEKEPLNK